MARSLSDLERYRLKANSVVSIDATFDHRRKGSLCVATMLSCDSRKIVDYEIATRPKQYVEGTANVASTNLEAEAVKTMVKRWENESKVTHYVHDNHGQTR